MSVSRLAAAFALGAGVLLGAQTTPMPTATELQRMAARFAPTEITADLSTLAPADRQVLAKLVQASRLIDALFLRQAWSGNAAMLLDLVHDTTPEGRARLHYFLINKGPWDRLDHHTPFVPGAPDKPLGADFYPEGATRQELERWLQSQPGAARSRATGFFSVIRRQPDGSLASVPYSVEYQNELTRAAALLREAAALATEPTLNAFLTRRADAFLSNDYYESDVAWMELRGTIEPTIGPYEVYEDELFNYKAAFESFITIRDEAKSARIQRFASELQEIENRLPIDPVLRNPKIGALAPLAVVNVVFTAGDANRGVQTAAFNLPNDEFDAFFTHIVVHEMMHGLGSHDITVNGRKTTVRQEMKDAYSFLEEAKADISGLYALQHLINKGVVDRAMQDTLYTTFLASAFRSIRFGINEGTARGSRCS